MRGLSAFRRAAKWAVCPLAGCGRDAARLKGVQASWRAQRDIQPKGEMKMKCALVASLCAVSFAAVTSCSESASFTDIDHLSPPSIDLRAISVDSGGVLKITVTVSNPTRVQLQVSNSAECSFAVRIFPDSTGEEMAASGASCASDGKTTDLAPGGSLILSRTFTAGDLTQYTAGQYGINVTVGTPTSVVTGWGGAVKLPLASKP